MRRGIAGGVRTGDWNWNWTGSPARKIHIFKYFSHGPQSPRHAALPPTAWYPLRTYYLPGTCLGIAAGTPRFWLPRNPLPFSLCLFPFFSSSFPCNYPAYYGAQHANSLFVDVCVCFTCIAVSHGSTFTGKLLLVETLRLHREM